MSISNKDICRLLIFQGVNPDPIRNLFDQCEVREVPAGELVLEPKKENRSMYVIIDGEVSIHLKTEDAAAIAHVGAGECIGELSVFDGKSTSAYVKTVLPTRFLIIPRVILLQMIDSSHNVARNLLYLLSNRLRSGNQALDKSRKLVEEYEKHANVDILTKLANRRWLNNFFQNVIEAQKQGDPYPDMALILIDVQGMKIYNDTYGQFAGDHALKCFTSVMQEQLREGDMACRSGGDDFMVILPHMSTKAAMDVADKIREAARNMEVVFQEKNYPALKLAIAVSQMSAEDSFVEVMSGLDDTIAEMKKAGGGFIKLVQ